MKIVKLDRRYSMCRHNDYWIALEFDEFGTRASLLTITVKEKLQEHYGPTKYVMFGNPCPWHNSYKDYGKREVIYLRDESMLTFLQLSGALEYDN